MSAQTGDVQLRFIHPSDLTLWEGRDIRQHIVDEIKENIEDHGYNPSRPMRVVKQDGEFWDADGNHRLAALRQLEYDEPVPCVVEENADLVKLSRECNKDEDTYAPQDLFDDLDHIELLDNKGLTQEEIAEQMGEDWSRKKVADHSRVLKKVVPAVRGIAREHQEGRGTNDVPGGTFDFTEYWFRTSGLYDLEDEWQEEFIEWFVDEQNCSVSKSKLKRQVEEYKDIQEQLEILEENLNGGVDESKASEIEGAIRKNEYTESSLRDAIEAANQDAKDQAYFGEDSVEKLKQLDANEIACVVTDPPYGVEYENHRDSSRPSFGEDAPEALDLMYDVFEQLERVCKANAHLYVFFPTKLYAEVKDVAAEFFDVEDVPLVWVKNNIAPTRDAENGFKKMYAQQYESVFHLRAENGDSRELNGKSSSNVLEHDIPKSDDRWHDSQKPVSLWEELITNSTATGETILDPFAGSGSALLAAKKQGRHYIGIEKSEEYESRFKRELREVSSDE